MNFIFNIAAISLLITFFYCVFEEYIEKYIYSTNRRKKVHPSRNYHIQFPPHDPINYPHTL